MNQNDLLETLIKTFTEFGVPKSIVIDNGHHFFTIYAKEVIPTPNDRLSLKESCLKLITTDLGNLAFEIKDN